MLLQTRLLPSKRRKSNLGFTTACWMKFSTSYFNVVMYMYATNVNSKTTTCMVRTCIIHGGEYLLQKSSVLVFAFIIRFNWYLLWTIPRHWIKWHKVQIRRYIFGSLNLCHFIYVLHYCFLFKYINDIIDMLFNSFFFQYNFYGKWLLSEDLNVYRKFTFSIPQFTWYNVKVRIY